MMVRISQLIRIPQGRHLIGLLVGLVLGLIVFASWQHYEADDLARWQHREHVYCKERVARTGIVEDCSKVRQPTFRVSTVRTKAYREGMLWMFLGGWWGTAALLWMVAGLTAKR